MLRPLYGRGIDYPLLLTFGLSYVMVELIRIAFGKSGYPFDTPESLQGAVDIGVGYFPLYRLFVIGSAAARTIDRRAERRLPPHAMGRCRATSPLRASVPRSRR